MPKLTLNLEVPKTPAPSEAPQRQQSRRFVVLGSSPRRVVLEDTIVAFIGASGAHCEAVLSHGERVATNRDAKGLVSQLRDALREPFIGCGGRHGFYPDHTFLRASGITSYAAIDDGSVKVWFGTAGPLIVPMQVETLEAHLREAFDVTMSEPQLSRVEPLAIPEKDLYTGTETERYLDHVHGNTWERMGVSVPGRK